MKRKFRIITSVLLSAALMVSNFSGITMSNVKAATSQFSNFITVDRTKLMDGNKELKFVSLNYPQATSDTPWEHANAMKTIKAMGGNVTRTYTIPVYNGENDGKAYVTGVDANGKLEFNEDALNALDSVLAEANKYGIRVIIPLVDYWHWIGGMDGYVWLAGESGGNKPSQSGFQSWAWKFYNSEKCIDLFEQMIEHLLNRTNTVTGVQYKDDKAILCWETGNEVGNRQQSGNTTIFDGTDSDIVLTAWTNEVVDYIKSIDKNHLVLDGRMSMSPMSLTENHADILGAHYYEGNYAQRCKDDTIAAHEAGKPFILGEFGAEITAQPCIDVFQQGLENDTNGIMMWSLRAHKDGFGYYFHNEDGYWASYHWPGFESGNYYGEKEIIRSIYAYAQIANGNASNYDKAKLIPIPAPETDEAPLLYSPDGTAYDKSFVDGSVGDIKWRGVVGGAWYEIQRADGVATADTSDSEWTTIAGEADYVYDSGRNWEDKTHDCIAGYHDETAVDGITYSYRLRACNESGVGLWSNIVTVNNTKHVVVDDLDLIAVSSTDPNPTEIRRTYSSDHSTNIEYSSSSIVNKSDSEGYIEYKAMIPVDKIVVTAVSTPDEGAEPKVFVSADGISYTELTVTNTPNTAVYSVENITEGGKCKYYYSRIYMAGKSACKLDSIAITYVNDGKSYVEELEGAEVTTNVMTQDNTFGNEGAAPSYTKKDDNLEVKTVDGVTGLTTTDANAASIIYKTGDDINAYRVVVDAKDGVEPKVEYSYDGVTFSDVAVLSTGANGSFKRVVYGDLNVSETVRVIRVSFPDNSQDKIIVETVEMSSGTKSIPLADKAPNDVLEDGEYYFGDNNNAAGAYTVTGSKSGATGSVSLDSNNTYTGNYGVALDYALDSTNKGTVYVDGVYVSSSTKVDDFEGYSGSDTLLNQAYKRNTNGGSFDLALDSTNKSEGSYGLRVDYDYKGTGYAGAVKTMDLLNLNGYDGFQLYIFSDGSGNDVKVQFKTTLGTYSYKGYMKGVGPTTFYMPFDKIVKEPNTTAEFSPNSDLESVAIYTDLNGSKTVQKGTFYVDDIKGAKFASDLSSETNITINTVPDEITSFPHTISGTANYVKYVSVLFGDKMFNVPVDADGNWSYVLTAKSGIYNGEDIAVKAGFYYPDGGVVKETEEKTVKINVTGNDAPIVESYDTVMWSWDFASQGTDGWAFDGFTPWVEKDGTLVAWSQSAFNGTFSYTINNIPNGVYTLQNDIKAKSTMDNVQMALVSGNTEVKSERIDTSDQLEQDKFLGEKITVTDNKITVKYYAKAPTDANGATFAVGDIKLYFVEGIDIIKNGDFSATDGGDPAYPTNWNVTPDATSWALKTQGCWWDESNNKVLVVGPGAFSLKQNVNVSVSDTGAYELTANIDTTNHGSNSGADVKNLVLKISNAQGTVKEVSVESGKNGVVKISGLNLTAGQYTVEVCGTMNDGERDIYGGLIKSLYIDDVTMKLMVPAPVEEDEIVWSWDFATDGMTGWDFDGAEPKLEKGNFIVWENEPYEGKYSYTVENIPNGVYTLQNDIKVKNENNSQEAYIVLSDGNNVVKSDAISTSDQMVENKPMGKEFTVTNHRVTVSYEVKTTAGGQTFGLGKIKLLLLQKSDDNQLNQYDALNVALEEAVEETEETVVEETTEELVEELVEEMQQVSGNGILDIALANAGNQLAKTLTRGIKQETVSVKFAKALDNLDYSAYDCVYAWVKPDDSGNVMKLQFTDKNGVVWSSEPIELVGTTGKMNKFSFADFTCDGNAVMDLSQVSKFAFVISGTVNVEVPSEPQPQKPSGNNNSNVTKPVVPPTKVAVDYKVVKGDTLTKIAKKFNVPLASLIAMNPQIKNPNLIYPGQIITVGYTNGTADNDSSNSNSKDNGAEKFYIVVKGDCLSKIAKKHGIKLSQLVKMNPSIARQKYIYAGQKVRVK